MASAYVGVCYGWDGKDLPAPKDVIELCRSKKITKIRIYRPNQEVLIALRGTGVELILGVPNDEIERLATKDTAATEWVRDNVLATTTYLNIRYIAVGNGVNPSNPNLIRALRNIFNAISASEETKQIKVTTAIDLLNLLGDFTVPSQANFRNDVRDNITPIIDFLVGKQAPLLANVYPYSACLNHPDTFSPSFALFTSPEYIPDGHFTYQNLFDFLLDGLHCALENLGQAQGNLAIVVSESGWPSTGSDVATIENARTYYTNLINRVGNGTGTPRRRTQAIKTYLFGLFDENQRTNDIEKHCGLFYPNLTPKYDGIFPLN